MNTQQDEDARLAGAGAGASPCVVRARVVVLALSSLVVMFLGRVVVVVVAAVVWLVVIAVVVAVAVEVAVLHVRLGSFRDGRRCLLVVAAVLEGEIGVGIVHKVVANRVCLHDHLRLKVGLVSS